mgnify:CR=1 FL=1
MRLPEDAHFALIDHLPASPSAFVRNGDGLVGWGEAVRLTARGPQRMSELAAAWRELVAATEVIDEVEVPGSGLVAFGSFAFANDSEAESVLPSDSSNSMWSSSSRLFVTVIGRRMTRPSGSDASSACTTSPYWHT